MISAKNGLLYFDGEPIGLPEADAVAGRYGFVYAEQLRDALIRVSAADRERILILALERARAAMEHAEGRTDQDCAILSAGMSEATHVLEVFAPKKDSAYWDAVRAFSAKTMLDIPAPNGA